MTWSHGALAGVAKSWKANGEPDYVGTYVANVRHGLWTYYGHDLGPLIRIEGMVVEGYNQGPWKGTYEASGNKESELVYSYNEINGPFVQWHDNGQEAAAGLYVSNLRHGAWLFHYDNGQVWVSAHYYYGQLDGEYEEYYPDGKPKAKGSFGATSTWMFWDENGMLTSCGPVGWAYMVCP